MPALTFSKWSCGGNTTLFLHDPDAAPEQQAAWARAVLDPAILGAEQAGIVSLARRTLCMAGGEFCVNASRAFAALLALVKGESAQTPLNFEVCVSGWKEPLRLTVRGSAPAWEAACSLRLPAVLRPEVHELGHIIRLPGISHLLLPPKSDPPPTGLLAQARAALKAAGLETEAAAGVIWWRRTPFGASMTPVVHVRDADTLVAEQACGSGALALALELERRFGIRHCQLLQPSGATLTVSLSYAPDASGLEAEISGRVALLARGRVWLESSDGEN